MNTTAPDRRYLSLVLPFLATDLVARRMSPEARARPHAVVAMEKGALRLAAVNAAALALGLAPGLGMADARARHPALEVSEAAPEAVARMLAQIADACERYTPLVSLDGLDGLVLDVTGCAHLFGGEAGLVRDLLRRVAAGGFSGRAALAATSGAAFALARFAAGRGGAVVPAEEDLAALLAPLPLDALRLDGPAVEALARLGFRRVGDLYGKPRAPLAARFGTGLLRRLDAALGHAPTAVDYRFPPPVFCAERALPEPVERVEDVLGLIAHLAETLAGALERQGMGARRLDLALFRVDGRVTRLAIGTSRPLRDPQVVRRLFAEKVATVSSLDPGFGFELVRLAVREAAPFALVQEGLGVGDDGARALDALVDRLTVRFGSERVQRLALADHHLPEEASLHVPAQGGCGWAAAGQALETQASELRASELRAGMGSPPGSSGEWSDPASAFPPVSLASRPSPPASAGRVVAAELVAAGPWARREQPAPASTPDEALSGPRGRGAAAGGGTAHDAGSENRTVYRLSSGRRGPAATGDAATGDVSARGEGGEAGWSTSLPLAGDAPDLAGPARPLRLLEPPEPVEAVAEVPDGPPIRFRWRRVIHTVVRAEGPERIAAPWWRTAADLPTRDYFRVETGTGHRFWLFRAGLYGSGAEAPAWFIHGLFG
ncbi:Y-family DNA polymerase [Xanthobacter agilis]|uniref:DNA-directed DNA polymerase n=1 Tax=Xanthobacter agilis TaxID=47492 RepID=A0ABU0LGN5_XANAG|nr:DNA polymerase Y family protein [Xanthobacter agilis]MDQ0506263.1 nucleotidyltransferase/DNA polymerase involved in DNA repair [Xanthobacter agilis]